MNSQTLNTDSADPVVSTASTNVWKAVSICLCLAGVAVLVVNHSQGFFWSWSDENIHLYVTDRVAAGESLYGTVHSARPPLALAPLVGLLSLGLEPLWAARIVVLLFVLATAAVLFWAGRTLWNPSAGVAAALLFLLSPAAFSRDVFTGINLVTFWTTLCAVLAVMRRPVLAGLAGGAALMTGQHAAVIVAATAVVVALQTRRALVQYSLSCLAVVVAVVFGVVVAGGSDIWNDLVGHHVYHFGVDVRPGETNLAWWMATWSLDNLPVLLLAGCALLLGTPRQQNRADQPESRIAPAWVLTGMATFHVIVIVLMRGGLILYVHPVIALFALVAGAGLYRTAKLAGASISSSKRPRNVLRLMAMLSICAVVATVAGWSSSSALYGRRDKQEYSLLPHLRFAEMAEIQRPVVADKIAAIVEAEATPRGTIFGHPTIASLVALKTDRRIAGELADLAPRWFKMGIVSREFVVERIEQDHVEFFVTPAWFFVRDPYFRRYLKQCYAKPVEFPREPGSGIPRILVFKRRSLPRPCMPASDGTRTGSGSPIVPQRGDDA